MHGGNTSPSMANAALERQQPHTSLALVRFFMRDIIRRFSKSYLNPPCLVEDAKQTHLHLHFQSIVLSVSCNAFDFIYQVDQSSLAHCIQGEISHHLDPGSTDEKHMSPLVSALGKPGRAEV